MQPSGKAPASTKSGSGYDAWWKISDLEPGCGVAPMKDYSQLQYGNLEFEAPAGNVVMFANSGGCVYSHIPASRLHIVL